jgi:hypothetical protein
VIVGNAAEVGPQLKRAGIAFETVGYLEPISKKDREEELAAKNAPPDPKATAAGKKLLDAALQARGGAAALRGLRDIVSRGALKLIVGDESVEGEFARALVPPDSLRIALKISGIGTFISITGPKGVWMSAPPRGTAELPKDKADLERASLWRYHDVILLRHLEPGTVVQALAPEGIGGVVYDAVRLRDPTGAIDVKVLLDPRTHLIFRIVYPQEGRDVVEEFGDYRDVAGMKYPYRMRIDNGDRTIETSATEVKVNGGVDPGAFEKP